MKLTPFYKRTLVGLLSLFFIVLASCGQSRDVELPEDIKQITNGDLDAWLKQAPFEGLWDPSADKKENTIVITNLHQVFPFIGKLKNADDDNKNRTSSDGDLHEEAWQVFKDPKWGEVVTYAQLAYDPEELFLSPSYSEMGNPVFSGNQDIELSYSGNLKATQVIDHKGSTKTGIYWVNSNMQTYLMGFYQNQNLVFEVAFPCKTDNKASCLEKLKDINKKLKLNVKSWENASVDMLETTNSKDSFWQNPYISIFPDQYEIPSIEIKIRYSDFTLQNLNVPQQNAAYLFSYKNDYGLHSLGFNKEKSARSRAEFEKAHEGQDFIEAGKLAVKLYLSESEKGDIHYIQATAYMKDKQELKVNASYPVKDPEARNEIMDIFNHLKIAQF